MTELNGPENYALGINPYGPPKDEDFMGIGLGAYTLSDRTSGILL